MFEKSPKWYQLTGCGVKNEEITMTEKAAPLDDVRFKPIFANYRDKAIFVAGGHFHNDNPRSSEQAGRTARARPISFIDELEAFHQVSVHA